MAKASKIVLKVPDQRMLEVMAMLKENGTIQYNKDFCNAIGLLKQNLVNIQKGTQYFTVDHITKACEAYNVSADWVHGLSEQIFREQAQLRSISEGYKAKKPADKVKRG